MRKWLGSAVVALVLTLAGCSAEQAPSIPVAPTGTSASSALSTVAEQSGTDVAALPASTPTEISIPKIGAKSTLVALGLNPDQTIEVPPVSKPMQAGWYTKAPTPGEVGPAVIVGHVDGNKQPGIFYRLKEMAAGDEILVSRQDGTTARFLVSEVKQVAKKEFPTDMVYGDTTDAELRLITCGGQFDHDAHSYVDNIVVFAKFTPSTS
jgi:LPXTG-site transpeptidase (sortase) family protein